MTEVNQTEFRLHNVIAQLIEQRQKWEQGAYAASNAELYTLLGSTLDLFLKARSDTKISRAVSDVLDAYGVQYNSGTSLALKIVRLVFVGKGHESKIANRSFTYARVLTVAAEQRITGAQLPQFIVDNHGIDEIRRLSKDGETKAAKVKIERDYALAVLASKSGISAVTMSDDLQPVDGGQYSLALVRKNDDGTGSIVFGTNSASAVNTVLSIAGKSLKSQAAKTAEQNVFKQDAEHRAENVTRLAQEMATSGQFSPQLEMTTPVTDTASV